MKGMPQGVIGFYKRRDNSGTIVTHPITVPQGTRFKPSPVNVFKVQRSPPKSLYAVKVRRGMEKSVQRQIEKIAWQFPKIGSTLVINGLEGLVLVEANDRFDVKDLLKTGGIRGKRYIMEGTLDYDELNKYIEKKMGIREPLKVGDYVDIVAGPFKGSEAKINRIMPNKEEIVLELLDPELEKMIPITVSTSYVERINLEKGKPEIDIGGLERRLAISELFKETRGMSKEEWDNLLPKEKMEFRKKRRDMSQKQKKKKPKPVEDVKKLEEDLEKLKNERKELLLEPVDTPSKNNIIEGKLRTNLYKRLDIQQRLDRSRKRQRVAKPRFVPTLKINFDTGSKDLIPKKVQQSITKKFALWIEKDGKYNKNFDVGQYGPSNQSGGNPVAHLRMEGISDPDIVTRYLRKALDKKYDAKYYGESVIEVFKK